jgi:Calx-beta domain-containing protein
MKRALPTWVYKVPTVVAAWAAASPKPIAKLGRGRAVVCAIPVAALLVLAVVGHGQMPPPLKPSVAFASSYATTNEKVGFLVLDVVLSESSKDTITVQWATSDGSATSPDDYTGDSGTLVFDPGVKKQSIVIEIIDDSSSEVPEYFTVTLSNADNATLGGASTCTVSIEDGAGSASAWVSFEYDSYICSEGDGTVTITVLMTGSPSKDVSVDYAVYNGSAKAGSDYYSTSGTLTWKTSEAGTTKSFTISIIDDSDPEDPETALLVLSNPVNVTWTSPSTAILYIVDDDDDVCGS